MNVELAWEQDIIGRGVVVSILDDGLEHTHPDLRDNYVSLCSVISLLVLPKNFKKLANTCNYIKCIILQL